MELTGKLSAVGGLTGTLSGSSALSGELSNKLIAVKTQTKSVVPTDEAQEVVADSGYAGLSKVTVDAIPQNYGKITYNGSWITVS